MKITLTGINLNEQTSLFDEPLDTNSHNDARFLEVLYKYILDSKSINGIEIEVPPMDFEDSCSRFCSIGKEYKGIGGIYFLFNKDNELLNIGNTSDLYDRIYKKWIGKNGGSRADFYFCDYYHNVAFFVEEYSLKRKLYEPYLINKLQPLLNSQFNYYDKSSYLETLQKEQDKYRLHRFIDVGYRR